VKTYLAILVLSAVATYLLTPYVILLAFRWGAVDQPNARKIHTHPMPRLGGLAVFCGFCLPWTGFYLFTNRVTAAYHQEERLFLTLLLAATMMLAIGAYDDIKGANAAKKFFVQAVAAVLLYYGGFRIDKLSIPFGHPLILGVWSLPVSVFWVVAITNAMNLLDGIDGLVTGVAACIALCLALINILGNNIVVGLLTVSLAGACLGFLPHNFSPAKIFLGDSGSLFIGIVLASIGTVSLFKAATATFVLVPVILFGLPLFDTTSVVLQRAFLGKPLFQADKNHVHHHLLRIGFNQKQAAIFLWVIAVCLGGLAVLASAEVSVVRVVGIGVLAFALSVAIWWAWHRSLRNGPNANDPPP